MNVFAFTTSYRSIIGMLPAAGLGFFAAVAASLPDPRFSLWSLALAAFLILACWILRDPLHWLVVFFFCAILLPPLPLPGGDSGLSVAPFAAAFGMLAGLVWIRRWGSAFEPLTVALLMFGVALVASLPFALWNSGWRIAAASLLRVGLFGISVLVFLYAYAGPRSARWSELHLVRYLFLLAVCTAIFACADFYFQFPAPAGFGDQYVWLDDSVLRRAQGFFYEASTLGNFCAFFLVMVAVSLLRNRKDSPIPHLYLLLGGVPLGVALMLSYSRASMINVTVALTVLAFLRLRQISRTVLASAGIFLGGVLILQGFAADVASAYWNRLVASFTYLLTSPNTVLSGRLTHWKALVEFIGAQPQNLLFGIGYKTLPYSFVTGAPVVADNTYLGLLVETGIFGLLSFLLLNGLILRTGWRALRSNTLEATFLGEWIFCFWCGQMVQMLSGDLITYWRVLPLYFWTLGAAARLTRASQ